MFVVSITITFFHQSPRFTVMRTYKEIMDAIPKGIPTADKLQDVVYSTRQYFLQVGATVFGVLVSVIVAKPALAIPTTDLAVHPSIILLRIGVLCMLLGILSLAISVFEQRDTLSRLWSEYNRNVDEYLRGIRDDVGSSVPKRKLFVIAEVIGYILLSAGVTALAICALLVA
jgi:hypothetical protein